MKILICILIVLLGANGLLKSQQIIVRDLGWAADKDLQAVRRVSVNNGTAKNIIGLFIESRITSGNQKPIIRKYGKIKFVVPAHKIKVCKIVAESIGRSSDVVLNERLPSWANLVSQEKIMVTTVVFEDGSFGSEAIFNQ